MSDFEDTSMDERDLEVNPVTKSSASEVSGRSQLFGECQEQSDHCQDPLILQRQPQSTYQQIPSLTKRIL
ncbi:Hypothetical protein FKW44_019906 [Caligus rogercresseyi]|uniref:Uncharacterized protein n=1 Tax=Caligus rogercresseyi TaxID=217165 RepID=A0A7T8GWI7_CALRO|nr:Hypothetical protein FKW44_019906 [Caligus rogercresseyi]